MLTHTEIEILLSGWKESSLKDKARKAFLLITLDKLEADLRVILEEDKEIRCEITKV